MSKWEKAKIYYKQAGFWYLLKRAINYFIFLIKKRKLIIIMQEDSLKVICGEKGIRIFWKETEVTQHHGLNVALQVLTQWHESSEALWKVKRVRKKETEAKIVWENIPVTQIWKIIILNPHEIIWNVKMFVEEEMEIEKCKVGILLSPFYKRWLNSYEDGSFPRINNWEKIKLNKPDSKFIGVRNYRLTDSFLPGFFLDFSNVDINTYANILNSSLEINSRILQVEIEHKDKFTPGWYDFFKTRIIIQDSEEIIEEIIERFRKDVVRDTQI